MSEAVAAAAALEVWIKWVLKKAFELCIVTSGKCQIVIPPELGPPQVKVS